MPLACSLPAPGSPSPSSRTCVCTRTMAPLPCSRSPLARRQWMDRPPAGQRLGRPDRSLVCNIWPFDAAWGVSVDTATLWQTLPQNLFALSLFPYLGFLYYLTKSKQAPPLALFGFYFLLAFVGVSIPAGIYAKSVYHTSLANVDWLHGGAESLLTVTNLLIVLGMRQAIREAEGTGPAAAAKATEPQAATPPAAAAAEGSTRQPTSGDS